MQNFQPLSVSTLLGLGQMLYSPPSSETLSLFAISSGREPKVL
jgi:hypothetical protein